MKIDDLIGIILVFGVLPVTIIIILYFLQKAKHKERMELIEKGVDLPALKRKESPFQSTLMWGMLAGGTGLGLLIAYVLLETKILYDDMILGILAMLFGGLGLTSYHFMMKKDDKKEV